MGTSIYGRNEDIPLRDQAKLFKTNFWGVVHGSLVALNLMRSKGGAIINLGSVLSDRAVPLQGMYSASKHAVNAFTDSLRMEIEKEDTPVSLTLIKPAAVDTMLTSHARSYMESEPELPAPVYAPDLVAGAILYAAVHPQRDVHVGAVSALMGAGAGLMSPLLDRVMRILMFWAQQKKQRSAPGRTDALYGPNGMELRQRQGHRRSTVHEHSLQTFLATGGKPLVLSVLAGAALLAASKINGNAAVKRQR